MDSKKIMLNALCSGAVGAIATKLIYGGANGELNFLGVNLPAYAATGVSCSAGSVVSDLTSDMIIKRMGVSSQIMNGANLATQVSVSGGATAAVLWAGGMPASNIPVGFAIGAGSKLGGDYVNQKVFDPKTGFIPLF